MSDQKPKSIKFWAPEDRPREKLLEKGTSTLSDAELIAILLGSGNNKQSAVELARDILDASSRNLNELGKRSIKDLMKFKGIGEAKAITIVAALELGRRRKASESVEKNKIKSSDDAYEILNGFLADLPHEEFWVLFLNQANAVISKQKITQGGISSTVVDIRIIMKQALDNYASSIILAHNHPSGEIKPSNQDINLTNQIISAANTLQIKVLDHIIIGDKKFYSFADNGILAN